MSRADEVEQARGGARHALGVRIVVQLQRGDRVKVRIQGVPLQRAAGTHRGMSSSLSDSTRVTWPRSSKIHNRRCEYCASGLPPCKTFEQHRTKSEPSVHE